MVSSCRLKQEMLESQAKKAKEKLRFTNGSSRFQQMSGSVTKEVRTAPVGNQTHYTKDSSKDNSLNKFMGFAQPNRREAVAGARADAFVRTELRDKE